MNEQEQKDYEEYQQYLEYLKSKGIAAPPSPKEQPSDLNILEKGLIAASPVLDPIGRVVDVLTPRPYISAGLSKLLEAQTGKEIAPEKKLLSGQAPSFSEIWEAQGVGPGTSLSELIPGAFSPTGEGLPLKKGGMFDVTPRGVLGGVMDIATGGIGGPVKALAKAVPGVSKVTQALPSKYSIMSVVSGIPKEAIETYAKNKKLVSSLDQVAAEELTQQAAAQARGAVGQSRKAAGQALQNAMEQAGNKTVNIVDFKKMLEDAAAMPKSALKNQSAQELYADMQGKIKGILTKVEEVPESLQLSPQGILEKVPAGIKEVPIPSELTAQQLFDMKQQLKEMADAYGGRTGLLSKLAMKDAPMVSKKFEADMMGAIKRVDDLIDNATSGASADARAQYAKLSKTADAADRYFSTPEKTFGTLSNISSRAKAPARRIMQEADKAFGTNLEQTGKILESAKYFNEPSWFPISSGGTTSTSRTISGAATGGYLARSLLGPEFSEVGALLGSVGQSPKAVKSVYVPASEMIGAIPSVAGQGIAASQKYAPAQMWMKLLEEQKKQGEQQ